MQLRLLTENTTRPSTRKYKCPLCEVRDTRDRLILHVEKVHPESINDDFPAARLIYNSINNRTEGKCRICNKPTKWDNNKCRYDSFCSEKCKEEYVRIAKDRMKKKYGKEYILDDPDHQRKMLEGRRISGWYKFTSGGQLPYVGSYEKKFLEFMDVFLHVKSIDIMASYPVVEYEYNNEKHFWILDYYYIPLNLALDIKDGGDNPNKREMPEYREKQRCKEYAIANGDEYNYMRLENNDFSKLILAMLEMKDLPEYDLTSDINGIRTQKYSHYHSVFIPEHMTSSSPIIGMGQEPRPVAKKDTIYFVLGGNRLNSIFGVSFDKTLKRVWTPNEEFKLESHSGSVLDDYKYKVYEFTDPYYEFHIDKLKRRVSEGCIFTPNILYSHFTERKLTDYKQLESDTDIKECMSYPQYLKMVEECLIATWTDDVSIPLIESTDISYPYDYAQDINGYYVYNKTTNYRSRSYDDLSLIPESVEMYISNGII